MEKAENKNVTVLESAIQADKLEETVKDTIFIHQKLLKLDDLNKGKVFGFITALSGEKLIQ